MQLHEQKEKENSSPRFTSGQKKHNLTHCVGEEEKMCKKKKGRANWKKKHLLQATAMAESSCRGTETLRQQGAKALYSSICGSSFGRLWEKPNPAESLRQREIERARKRASKQHPQNVARFTTLPWCKPTMAVAAMPEGPNEGVFEKTKRQKTNTQPHK